MKTIIILISLMACGQLRGVSFDEIWDLSSKLHASMAEHSDQKVMSQYIADCHEDMYFKLLIKQMGLESAERMKDGIPPRAKENFLKLKVWMDNLQGITSGVKSEIIGIEPLIMKDAVSGQMIVHFVSIKFAFGIPPERPLYEIVMPGIIKIEEKYIFESGPISIKKLSKWALNLNSK